METVDGEVRAAGRTYRTPRRLLVPSAALVEGRAPVSHQTARGGLTTHPFLSLVPVCPLPHFPIPVPWYQSVGSGGYEAAVRSRPPGQCHPRARWRPLRSYGTGAQRRTGDLLWHALATWLVCIVNAAGGQPDGAAGARPLCAPLPTVVAISTAGGPVDGATGARPLCAPRHRSSHRPNGWRRWVTFVTNCLRRSWQPFFVAGGPYFGTHLHVCTFMTSELHDTIRGKPISPLSSLPLFPSASSLPVGPRCSLPFCGCPRPALCAFSRLSARSSRCPSLFPLCPVLPPSTLHDTVPDTFSSLRDPLDRGRACCPAARGTPPFPSRRLSICVSPHLGLPQCSSALDSDTTRKLHAMLL